MVFSGEKVFNKESKKERIKLLSMHMAEIAAWVNQEMKEHFGVDNFLTSEGSIDMAAYAGRQGWSRESLEQDLAEIKKREIGFSNANNENVKAFYAEEYGAQSTEGILRIWRDNKKKEKNSQFEIATTAVLHKMFSEDFVVVRASTYDDYEGVDNILVNKKTGDVVCAFDEVHESKINSRRADKEKKVEKIAEQGGISIKYGLQILKGKLVEKEIRNLPVFYLGISTEDLEKLLSQMNFSLNEGLAGIEYEIIQNFLSSLEEQKNNLEKLNLLGDVRNNLVKFRNSLSQMKDVFKKKYAEK